MGDAVPPPGPSVWIVNQYADAPDRPNGTRHFDLGRQLVARGHRVTIFAAGFSNVTHCEQRLRGRELYRSACCDGVRFVWLRTIPYGGNTWRRPLNMVSFTAAFLVVQSRIPCPDTIIGSTVHPFAAAGAWLAARLRGARFIFEVRDLWPQTLVDLGALRDGSPGERLLRFLESFLVRRASVVIALLPGMRTYLRERGLPDDTLVFIPNGVDLEVFDAAADASCDEPEALQPALGVISRMHAEGRFVLGYVGSFGRVNRAGLVVQAAERAEERAPGRLAVVLVGDGPERVLLERAVADSQCVAVSPPVPKRLVPRLLRAFDAGIVHVTDNPVYRYGISFNKLFEYMASSLPIVFACRSAYDPVAAAHAGLSTRPDDATGLADAMLEMAGTHPDERARMGAAGRGWVEARHDITRLGQTLDAALRSPATLGGADRLDGMSDGRGGEAP